MSEQQTTKRASAPVDGEHGRSGKTPRAPPQAIAPRAVVKREREDEGDATQGSSEGEASQGGSEGGGPVASVGLEAMDEPQITVTIGVSLLHCHACILPLRPPTFKCEAGHVVCFTCRGKHGEACGHVSTYAACPKLDAKLPCKHQQFGCKSMVAYCKVADHHAGCLWAPCSCPAPGCGVLTSPSRLVEHFHTDHHWPVTSVRYGAACKLPVPAPAEGCHVLVGEADRSVFLVSPFAFGAATDVSLVCVRAGGAAAAAAAQFKCTLWVELPSTKEKLVLIMPAVRSSDLSGGFQAADKYMLLPVPPVLLHEASGKAPDLMVCIEKADAAAANSTAPPARCSGGLQE